MVVCIEGGDACGKATQSKILAERLKAKLFAFPNYETATGKAILGNLQSKWFTTTGWDYTDGGDACVRKDQSTNALVLQSLMLANRMEQQAEISRAAGHVVFDRYTVSAEVYGMLDGLDPAWLRATNAALAIQPDVFVLLDAPVEEGFRRRPERRDRYESDRPRLEKVRETYLRLFAERQLERAQALRGGESFNFGPRYMTVDAVGTVEEVAHRVWLAVAL